MGQNLTEGQINLFDRLDAYVSSNQIDLLAFWKTSRLCLTIQEFVQLLLKVGFEISSDQLHLLERDSVEFVNLQTLIKSVQTWQKKEGNVSSFINRQGKQSEELSKSKINKKIVKDGRSHTLSSFSNYSNSRVRAIERQIKKESRLNETLIRTKNQSDYQITIKVGQANDICKKLKNESSFIINADGELKIIQVKTKTGEEIELSRKLFEKRYEQLKTSSLARTEQVEGTLEEDLKKVLVEVMYLSGQLEQQIRLLQTKGVSH